MNIKTFIGGGALAAALVLVISGCGNDDSGAGGYVLIVNGNPSGGGTTIPTTTPSVEVRYAAGSLVTVIAMPASDYTFSQWTVEKGASLPVGVNASNTTITFNMPNYDLTLTANFELIRAGIFLDDRDNKMYITTKIGDQTWMAENLNYRTLSGNSWCYNSTFANCDIYGRLYDWATAMNINTSYNGNTWGGSDEKRQGICPVGWHLPSRAEWDKLVKFVESDRKSGVNTAGIYLKSTLGFNELNNDGDYYGFSALPGGRYGGGDSFYYGGIVGYFWTSTEDTDDSGTMPWSRAYGRSMESHENNVSEEKGWKADGYSVRCVQD